MQPKQGVVAARVNLFRWSQDPEERTSQSQRYSESQEVRHEIEIANAKS